ncbi:hypothetical protein ACIQPT_34880 [Streptomyces sp. NPDC091289]|uniref:hypothetical protein n=1 Tax=Streptomyces sp. NPDC091289 TaxID=3365989 RepID=UPI0037F20C02
MVDRRTEFQIGGTWTDVSSDVRESEPITIERGAKNESAKGSPSKCTLKLNNRDGRYSPRNPMSPYYGLIGRNTPIRVSVKGPESYLRLEGNTSSYARTPDIADLDITGDIDVRVEATADWYGTTSQALLGKWDSDGNQRSYLLRILDGTIVFNWSTAGSATLFAQRPLPALPKRAALRATLDVNNGAGGFTARFYWAPTMDGPWSQIGDVLSSTPATSIYSGSTPLEIAPVLASGVTPLEGQVHRAEVRAGINGTVVADFDVRSLPEGTTGWTDSVGRTWTVGSDATITDRQYRFHGEISAWPTRWDVSGSDIWVPIDAAGIRRRLGQGQKALASTLRRRIPAFAPLAYWPCEDEDGATQAYSPIEGVRPLKVTGGWRFGQDNTLAGSSALPAVDAGAHMVGNVRAPGGTSTQWSVHMVYTVDSPPATDAVFLSWRTTGTVQRWQIVQRENLATIQGFDEDGATVVNQFAAIGDDVFDGWQRFYFWASQSGGTVTWRLDWYNIGGSAGGIGSTYSGTTGRVSQIDTQFGASVTGLKVGHIAVLPVASTAAYTSADHGFSGESAIARMRRLANEEEAQLNLSWIDGDTAMDTERLGPQRPDTLMDLVQEAADTDGGILYEPADRLGLVYRDRASLYTQPVRLALDYTAPGEVPPPLEPTEDDQRLRNDVTVTRSGGSSGRAVAETGPLSVEPPPAGVGIYDESVTLSLATDDQPERIAAWRMHLGTWDEARYPTISVWLHAAPHLIDDVLGLDIGDRIQISNPPSWLPPGGIDQHMLGYTERLGLYDWALTMNCAPAGPWQVGSIGAPVLGHVDTDGSELAGAVSASDTALPVQAVVGPTWVEAPPPLNANSTFGEGLAGWSGSGGTIDRVPAPWPAPTTDRWALRLTPDGVAQYPNAGSDQIPVTAGQAYTLSGWLRCAGGRNVALNMNWFGPSSSYLDTSSNDQDVNEGEWTRFELTATAPVGAETVNLAPTVPDYPPATDVLWASHLTLRPAGGSGSDFPFDIRVGGEVMTVQGVGPATTTSMADTFARTITPTVTDTFGRTVAGGWGSADTGQAWTTSGGTAGDYAVGSGAATMSAGVVNSSRFTQLAALSLANVDVQADITVPVVATGASISTGLRLRAADTSNYYYVEVVRGLSGAMSLNLVSRVSAVSTVISGPVSKGTYVAGETWTVRARLVGSTLVAKLWRTSTAEPSGWDAQAVTTTIPAAGPVGLRTILSTGNTNTLPVVATFDNVRVTTVATGWGTSTSGQAWTTSGGTATEYTVDGTRGLVALASVNASRRTLIGSGITDSVLTARFTLPAVALTDSIDLALMSRHTSSSNYYYAVLHCHNDGTLECRLRKIVGGVFTTLAIGPMAGSYTAGSRYWLRFQTKGTRLSARGWQDGTAEPSTWDVQWTDSELTAPGQVGTRMNLQEFNTNPLPMIIAMDSFSVQVPQPQEFTVIRSRNGIAKGHQSGTDVRLAYPSIVAL